MTTCELCGTEVVVVGHTTKHYEPAIDVKSLQAENLQMREALDCMKNVVSISDRKHDIWDKAKIAISKIECGHTQKIADRIKALEEVAKEAVKLIGHYEDHETADFTNLKKALSKLDELEKLKE